MLLQFFFKSCRLFPSVVGDNDLIHTLRTSCNAC